MFNLLTTIRLRGPIWFCLALCLLAITTSIASAQQETYPQASPSYSFDRSGGLIENQTAYQFEEEFFPNANGPAGDQTHRPYGYQLSAATLRSAETVGHTVGQAVTTAEDYLPEGMIPALSGRTDEAHRHYGVGQPLEGTSWLNKSHSAGAFLGGIGGTALIDDQLQRAAGSTFGLRFGIDYDHRWGLEKRFGFAQMSVFDNRFNQRQVIDLELGDFDLMFYPWGDSRWRPYMASGVGLAHFNYQSDVGHRIDRLLIEVPFGIGVKYLWSEGVAVRGELTDNLMLGTHELSTMNNISLAIGIEFRYAGFRLKKEARGS